MDDLSTTEELAEAGYMAALAEIVVLALFIAMVWVWFGVFASGPVQ